MRAGTCLADGRRGGGCWATTVAWSNAGPLPALHAPPCWLCTPREETLLPTPPILSLCAPYASVASSRPCTLQLGAAPWPAPNYSVTQVACSPHSSYCADAVDRCGSGQMEPRVWGRAVQMGQSVSGLVRLCGCQDACQSHSPCALWPPYTCMLVVAPLSSSRSQPFSPRISPQASPGQPFRARTTQHRCPANVPAPLQAATG